MNSGDDFKLEMSKYVPVEVSTKKVYSSKNVKVKYRCEYTEDWVDITNDLLTLTLEDNQILKHHLSEYRNTEHGSDFDSFKLF